MEKTLKNKMGFISSICVALFTILFMIALPFTFRFSSWKGIQDYAATFKQIELLTVIPSLLLAISYVILVVTVNEDASQERKYWSHLAIAFGIMYATICSANYFIQLVTVAPSINAGELEGLGMLAAGYSNSIFFALMASYFFMCLSTFFLAEAFEKEKENRVIRFSLKATGLTIPLFLIGAITLSNILMPLAVICWLGGTIVGTLAIAYKYYKENK